MGDRGDGLEMDAGGEDPALAVAARHALHDEELVAAFATDGDDTEDAARARALVDRCQACRDLHTDLVAIGASLRALPDAAMLSATQRAPREFRLSVDAANRLRPGSAVPRLWDRIKAALAALGRPVGMSMASLGVVGLVLGTLTLGGAIGTGGPTDDRLGGVGAAGAPGGPPASGELQLESQAVGGVSGSAGGPTETKRTSFEAMSTDAAAPSREGSVPAPVAGSGPTLPALVVAGSLVLLVGGVALFVLGSQRREPAPGR